MLAVKDAAARQHISIGKIVSALIRKALMTPAPVSASRNGALIFGASANAPMMTLETVNRLRDEG